MKPPRALHPFSARCTFGLAINPAQIPYILWRNTELPHHRSEFFLQLGGIRELLPFQRPSEQVEAILVRRFRNFQLVPSPLIDRPERGIELRSERQRHGDGLAFRSWKILQMLFGEPVEKTLQLPRDCDQ